MKAMAFAAAAGAAATLFIFVPEIDVAASHLFYREGQGFFLFGWPPLVLLFEIMPRISTATAILVGVLTVVRLTPALKRFHVRGTVIAYIALSLALGPGLVTNIVLKDNLGRARPKQTVEFGGTRHFTPAFVVSDQCPKNCAFVSGHAATGFFVATFAFLMAPGRARKAVFAGAVILGAVAGVGRIADGAHYLSDIVFAGFINIAIAWALYALLVERNALVPAVERWRRWQATLGRTVRDSSRTARKVSHALAFAMVSGMAAASYLFLDRPADRWFRSLGGDFYVIVDNVGELGKSEYWLLPSILAFAVLWFAARRPWAAPMRDRLRAWSMAALFLFAAVSVTGIAAQLLKIVFGRARPKLFHRSGDYGFEWFQLDGAMQSFPSGHAMTISAAMTALFFLFPRYFAVYAVTGAAVVLARAAEGDHYLSDVVFGSYLAIVMTAWIHRVFERSGIDLAAAAAGQAAGGTRSFWPERLAIPSPVRRRFATLLRNGRRHVPPVG